MMWVCRAGVNSVFFSDFVSKKIIGLPWSGYKRSLSNMRTREEFKDVVREETGADNRTSISNWGGQLYSFCVDMQIGDYVLIPAKNSRYYVLATIDSDYIYAEDYVPNLHHIRKIKILNDRVDKELFTQSLKYSLGAYRTIFKCKEEELVLSIAQEG